MVKWVTSSDNSETNIDDKEAAMFNRHATAGGHPAPFTRAPVKSPSSYTTDKKPERKYKWVSSLGGKDANISDKEAAMFNRRATEGGHPAPFIRVPDTSSTTITSTAKKTVKPPPTKKVAPGTNWSDKKESNGASGSSDDPEESGGAGVPPGGSDGPSGGSTGATKTPPVKKVLPPFDYEGLGSPGECVPLKILNYSTERMIIPQYMSRHLKGCKKFIIDLVDHNGHPYAVQLSNCDVISAIALMPVPETLTINSSKITNRYNTMTRWVEEHWGDEIDTITFSGGTFGFYQLLNSLNGTGEGLTVDHRRSSEAYEMLREIASFYQFNGMIYQNASTYDKSYLTTEFLRGEGNERFLGNHPRKGLPKERLYLKMDFDYITCLGYFDSFDIVEDDSTVFRLKYSLTFKSEKTIWNQGITATKGPVKDNFLLPDKRLQENYDSGDHPESDGTWIPWLSTSSSSSSTSSPLTSSGPLTYTEFLSKMASGKNFSLTPNGELTFNELMVTVKKDGDDPYKLNIDERTFNIIQNYAMNVYLPIRLAYGKPLRVSSGFRTEASYHRLVMKGDEPSKTSDHFFGQKIFGSSAGAGALDLVPVDGDAVGFFNFLKNSADRNNKQLVLPKGYVVNYGQILQETNKSTWVHLSGDRTKVTGGGPYDFRLAIGTPTAKGMKFKEV